MKNINEKFTGYFSVVLFILFITSSLYSLDMSKIGPKTEKVDLSLYHQIIYVSMKGEKGDGTRKNPYRSLINAISFINEASQQKRYAVLVSEGVYHEGTVYMKSYIDLFGGYCSEKWDRNIFKNRSELNGEGVRRVVVGADHARIDGFVITHGVSRSDGGGILCDDTSPTISNNFIVNNLVLEPDDFNHNRIHQHGNNGGGIACLYNAVPVIRNNYLSGNRTSVGMGAGIMFLGWLRVDSAEEPVLVNDHLEGGLRAICEDNVIVGNTAGVNDLGRTRSSSGGGIATAYEARPIISNNVIAGNRAKGRSDAGGVYCEFYSSPDIIGNWILGNVSDDDGGGIYTMRMGQPLIKDNFIAGNWTEGRGCGGIRLSKEGRADIVGNIIVHNQSGGGVQCVDSYMRLADNIIMHNKGGGALSIRQNFKYFSGSKIRNNILRENEGKEIAIGVNSGNPLRVKNNNIEGGYNGNDNFDKQVTFKTASLSGQIKNSQVNKIDMTTTFSLRNQLPDRQDLAGRVIRVGNQWMCVRDAGRNYITVWGIWGNDQDEAKQYEIISDYKTEGN